MFIIVNPAILAVNLMQRMMRMLGDYIKGLREKKGYSLTQLADKAGVSKSYLSMIERNLQQNPSIQFLEKISEILGRSVESIIQQNDSSESTDKSSDLDEEWLLLVKQAMESNIDKNEFKEFLEFQKWKKDSKQ